MAPQTRTDRPAAGLLSCGGLVPGWSVFLEQARSLSERNPPSRRTGAESILQTSSARRRRGGNARNTTGRSLREQVAVCGHDKSVPAVLFSNGGNHGNRVRSSTVNHRRRGIGARAVYLHARLVDALHQQRLSQTDRRSRATQREVMPYAGSLYTPDYVTPPPAIVSGAEKLHEGRCSASGGSPANCDRRTILLPAVPEEASALRCWRRCTAAANPLTAVSWRGALGPVAELAEAADLKSVSRTIGKYNLVRAIRGVLFQVRVLAGPLT